MSAGGYAIAFAVTVGLESPVVAGGYGRRAGVARALLACLFVNALTHGALWWTWGHLPGRYLPRVLGAEVAVFLVETALYVALLGGGVRRAAAVSAVANALSTAAGLALPHLRG